MSSATRSTILARRGGAGSLAAHGPLKPARNSAAAGKVMGLRNAEFVETLRNRISIGLRFLSLARRQPGRESERFHMVIEPDGAILIDHPASFMREPLDFEVGMIDARLEQCGVELADA